MTSVRRDVRRRRILLAGIAGLAASVGVAALAQAAITGTAITMTSTKTKQFKKEFGPMDMSTLTEFIQVPPTPIAQTAEITSVDFDRDIKFSPGKIGQCTTAQLAGTSTEAAKAACPTAVIGGGVAKSCSAAAGCEPGEHQLDVTMFNGVPQGGAPVLILHLKGVGAIAALPPFVVPGRLIDSPLAGQGYGKRLVIPDQPDVQSTGFHLRSVRLDLAVMKNGLKKKVKGAKNPKTGKRKVKKVPQYYVMGRCSDKSWQFRTETTFRAGGGTHVGTSTTPCQQKAAKKKKK
jgi:hypothetical protein